MLKISQRSFIDSTLAHGELRPHAPVPGWGTYVSPTPLCPPYLQTVGGFKGTSPWPWSPTSSRRGHLAPLECTTRSSAIAEGPRDASCQLKSCQLPRNSAETTCTTRPEQIEVMKLQGYSGPMCNKHVHSTMTRSSRYLCLIGVINKPTTVELCISPVCRRLAVAKFFKSTM